MDEFDFNDFGFTAVDESELSTVSELSTTLTSQEERLDKLYKMVLPLLSNLKKTPEKDYIFWPNRVEIIEKFEAQLESVYKG
jgi:uncharacterized protein Yka (UPF0111/DUF47 family)